MNPYFETALGKLYHGDCLEIMPQLEPVDLVLTDPPYGVEKAEWDNVFPVFWIKPAWQLASRMLVATGNTALIYAATQIGNYRDLIILHSKNGMTRSKISFGNFIPVLACGNWSWVARPNYIGFSVRLNEKIQHPSPKPIEALLSLCNHYVDEKWTVLDPFLGSGTTAVACERLNRRWIGIEIEEKYCEIAAKRIELEVKRIKRGFMSGENRKETVKRIKLKGFF